MEGKLVFGYGGIADSTPCIYKDHGWFEGTIPEYNIRKVETIYLFKELTWKDEVECGEPYGRIIAGGRCQLCEISIDEIQRLRALNEERKIQRLKTEEEELKKIEITWAKAIIKEIESRDTPILSEEEEKKWRVQYNNVMNEGGEGYIPHRATLEDIVKAEQILK